MSETQIRPDYKRTEVGVIPEDWEVSTLGSICSFENGDRGANYPSPGSFVPEGVPFVNAGHISEGRIYLHEMDYITQENFTRLGSGKVRPGDILFCLRGSLGKFGVVGSDFGEGAIASSLVIVRPKRRNVIRQFLECYFASAYCFQMIQEWAGGAAQPNLGAQDLSRFTIPLPPIPEQSAIAEALSDVDTWITSIDKLIAKKRAVKQAAMQALITGRVRLPGFEGEWEVRRLGDVSDIRTGDRNNEDKVDNGQYPFFVRSQTVERINTYSYDGEAILVPGEGGIGSIFHYIKGKFDFHQRVYKISGFDEDISAKFVYYFMMLNFHKQATRNSVKATVDSLRLPTFKGFEITLPSLEEQVAIAEVLSDMDTKVEALERQRAKALAIKQGMMQELLSGRIRLVEEVEVDHYD
jgi:type I restriction enzyme S subunit